ncbi:hypothetical protein KQI38_07660 [Tissierella carlieri]|nr:hypothetical protein [Tissierella carlieri]MBU5311903.1 hypothetical protein [Tissierella carlieri]
MLDKIIWCLRQLFPLTYRTTYIEKGKKHFVVWKMWFGKCYKVEDYIIA